jgi:putative FmdB family regulatory protein
MPIYEYRCQACHRTSSFLILSQNESFTPVCQRCGSHSLERVLSRVHVRLSEETRLERLADPSAWAGVDENDPKSIAKAFKKMGQGMGEDFPGEVDELVEEAMDSHAGDVAGEPDLDL